jgi:hypothetical protein
MISLQNRWLFIHNPRTGGNSLQSVLQPYSDDRLLTGRLRDGIERFGVRGPHTPTKHASMMDYADTLSEDVLARLFKFTIVRNPWERAISAYFTPIRWIRRRVQPVWTKSEFVAGLAELPLMTDMLRRADGAIEIDCILRFETLHADVAALFTRFGLEHLVFPHRNKGFQERDWRQYYVEDPELIELVGEVYREDAEVFDYRFPR